MSDMKIADPMYISGPHCCCLCAQAPQEPGFLIDTGRFHHLVGTMYICSDCRSAIVEVDDKYVLAEDVASKLAMADALALNAEAQIAAIEDAVATLQKEAT